MSRGMVDGPTDDGWGGELSDFMKRFSNLAGKASALDEEASLLEADMQEYAERAGHEVSRGLNSVRPGPTHPNIAHAVRPGAPAPVVSGAPPAIPLELLHDCELHLVPVGPGKSAMKLCICIKREIVVRPAHAELVVLLVTNHGKSKNGQQICLSSDEYIVATGLQADDHKKFAHTYDGWINRLRDDLKKAGIPREFVETLRKLGVRFWRKPD